MLGDSPRILNSILYRHFKNYNSQVFSNTYLYFRNLFIQLNFKSINLC